MEIKQIFNKASVGGDVVLWSRAKAFVFSWYVCDALIFTAIKSDSIADKSRDFFFSLVSVSAGRVQIQVTSQNYSHFKRSIHGFEKI